MRALCVSGMPGCGKEEFVAIIKEKGISVVRMGDIVRAEAKRRGLPLTDANVGALAHEERLKHGYGVWATRTLPHIRGDAVVIDGVRSDKETEIFRKALGGSLVVLAIHAAPDTRYKRIVSRGREDDVMTRQEFDARDQRELGWGMGKVISLADYVIVNEGSKEEFGEAAQRVLTAVFHE